MPSISARICARFQVSRSIRFSNIDYLESLFGQCTDFSLHSAQIEQGIQDLEADYLLSSTRSNLLRVLQISGDERVRARKLVR